MARRRGGGKKEVSLFPFLDILGCLIGSLILIITTVVLEQMDQPSVAAAAKIDELKVQAEAERQRAAALRTKLDATLQKAGATDRRVADARARADEAARREAEAQRKLRDAERLAVDKPAVPPPPDLAATEAERKRKEAEIAALEREIAARRTVPEQAIAILPPESGAGGGPKRGVFVEAAKGNVVVHDAKQRWEAATDKAVADPRFKTLLESTKADRETIVTFLIRPDGVDTYKTLQKAADAAGARTGRVPLPGSGAIDLSGAR